MIESPSWFPSSFPFLPPFPGYGSVVSALDLDLTCLRVSVRVSVCVLLFVLLRCKAEISLLLFNPLKK